MFSEKPSVRGLTESELIGLITHWLGDLNPRTPEGIGDDCAVFQPSGDIRQIMTTDALVYGRHFDDSISAEQAGAKLVNRNLSDIAAMGGVPDRAVLNLLFGPNLDLAWLEGFIQGLRRAAAGVDLKIVGGDICSLNPGLFISMLTVLGTAASPLTRGSAQIGDAIYVTGELGGSLKQKHAAFTPRLAEGQWLAGSGCCTTLMDLTDGLAKDLPAILADGQSAEVDVHSIPVAHDAHLAARHSGRSALEHAFCDGEDYELLFTIQSSISRTDFMESWAQAFPQRRICCIGRVVESSGRALVIDAADGSTLCFVGGFEHFSGS